MVRGLLVFAVDEQAEAFLTTLMERSAENVRRLIAEAHA